MQTIADLGQEYFDKRQEDLSTPIPGGKARIKQNVWGNWNGYVGKKKVMDFGTDERDAQQWLAHQGKATA